MTGTDATSQEAPGKGPAPAGGEEGDVSRPGVPHAHAVEDVTGFELDEGVSQPSFRARWQLFLPTIAIAVVYSAAWFYLAYTGKGHYSLAKLVVIVMAVGVPLLAAHAFLRYQTIRVQVLADTVRYHPGWPRDTPIDMPFELIDRVRIKHGLSGRLFGGGTLVMDLTTGEKAAVADLCNPGGAREAIEKRMQARDAGPLTGALEF